MVKIVESALKTRGKGKFGIIAKGIIDQNQDAIGKQGLEIVEKAGVGTMGVSEIDQALTDVDCKLEKSERNLEDISKVLQWPDTKISLKNTSSRCLT